MNRIRFGLTVTCILAAMFAAASLLDSLFWVGIWAAVSAGSFIAQDIIAGMQREAAKAYHPSSQGRA